MPQQLWALHSQISNFMALEDKAKEQALTDEILLSTIEVDLLIAEEIS